MKKVKMQQKLISSCREIYRSTYSRTLFIIIQVLAAPFYVFKTWNSASATAALCHLMNNGSYSWQQCKLYWTFIMMVAIENFHSAFTFKHWFQRCCIGMKGFFLVEPWPPVLLCPCGLLCGELRTWGVWQGSCSWLKPPLLDKDWMPCAGIGALGALGFLWLGWEWGAGLWFEPWKPEEDWWVPGFWWFDLFAEPGLLDKTVGEIGIRAEEKEMKNQLMSRFAKVCEIRRPPPEKSVFLWLQTLEGFRSLLTGGLWKNIPWIHFEPQQRSPLCSDQG